MSKRLRPSEPTIDLWKTSPLEFHPTQGHSMVYRPDTELQAFMEAAPNQDPEESWETMHGRREYAADLIETLEDVDQYVIHAIFYQRLSLRKIGMLMGRDKNWVARKRDSALRKMRASGL